MLIRSVTCGLRNTETVPFVKTWVIGNGPIVGDESFDPPGSLITIHCPTTQSMDLRF